MRIILGVSAAILTVVPVSATAQTNVDRGNGYFFNKAGATAEEAAADTARCRAIAEGADSQIKTVNVLAGGLGGIIGGAFAGGRLKRINIENCMLINGWRLYAMTRDEGSAWKAMPAAERDRELATLAGAQTPTRGTLLRQWRNDYAEPVLWQKN